LRELPLAPSVGCIDTLAYYTLELTRPTDGWIRLTQLTARARQASEQLRREGTPVRFVRSIFVPEDETCFYLYEAPSADDVREAARRAAIPVESLVEAITDQPAELTFDRIRREEQA
jgi:hypothetical protein